MRNFYQYGWLFLGLFLYSGCTTSIENKGCLIQSFDLEEIKVGVDSKQTVAKVYGQPSTTSIFNKEGEGERWYYICRSVVQSPLKGKKTLQHQSVVIVFNTKGIVSKKYVVVGENEIPISKQVTKDMGYKTTFFREMFGNIGKFAQSSKPGQ